MAIVGATATAADAVVGEVADWPCQLWPVDTACCGKLPDDPDQWSDRHWQAVQVASETLWRLTAGRYGVCGRIAYPCPEPCDPPDVWFPSGSDFAGPGGFGWMSPVLDGGRVRNVGCTCPGPDCACGPVERVELPAPVHQVVSVVIDGVELPPDAYRVMDRRWLVRRDGKPWPSCQQPTADPGEPGSFVVALWVGTRPPLSAVAPMGVLTCELLKRCDGDGDCRLPSGTTRVQREGLDYEITRPSDPAAWLDVLPEVRSWVALHNPTGSLAPSAMVTPDLPPVRSAWGWPTILRVSWEPDPDVPTGITVTVTGAGPDGAVVDFGDNSRVRVRDDTPVQHDYEQGGTWTVTACATAHRQCDAATVTVKTAALEAWLYTDADNDHWVLAWVDDPDPAGRYEVDWGDGHVDPIPPPTADRLVTRPRIRHPYAESGTYEVTVTDRDTLRSVTRSFVVGQIGMLFTYPTSADQPRVEARWLARHARWELDWGDGTPPVTGLVGADGEIAVTYDGQLPAGDYYVTLSEYPQEQQYTLRRRALRVITIPTDWDWGLAVWMTWRAYDDPDGQQTVELTPRNAARTCQVTWGDGASSTVDPGATVTHTYELPVPAYGLQIRVTEPPADDAPRRMWRRVLAEPRLVAAPVMSTRAAGAVDLVVAGLAADHNADWYYVDWGDGTTDAMGAVGRWYPAGHVYDTEGTYRVTVDSPGMPAPVSRMVVVRMYPTPEMQVREYHGDQRQDRRAIEVTIDNREPEHCGGTVRMRWGDRSGLTRLSEQSTHIHRFPHTGREDSYTVIAACDADSTARTRERVTVPFGPPSTLEVVWSRGDSDYQALLTVTAKDPAKTVQVRWGDSSGVQIVPPSGVVAHTYPAADSYMARASYVDGSESTQRWIDIPWMEGAG